MVAAALSSGSATNPRFVNLHMAVTVSTDSIPVRAHHASPQLVEDLEGGFIAGKAKLPLELCGAHSGREAGDKVSTPKPNGKRCMGALHDGSSGKPYVLLTRLAAQYAGAISEAVRLSRLRTPRADKAVFPTDFLQVCSASGIVRKQPLKGRKAGWEVKVSVGVNVLYHVQSPHIPESQPELGASYLPLSLQAHRITSRMPAAPWKRCTLNMVRFISASIRSTFAISASSKALKSARLAFTQGYIPLSDAAMLPTRYWLGLRHGFLG